MPKISFGLPVYNGEQYLSECIESILNQTFKDFELIISDNASTDCTEMISDDYRKKDKRIKYVRNKANIGAVQNYNNVFHLSNGAYFKWMGADDICSPEFLEKTLEILEKNPKAVLCYSNTMFIDENGEKLGQDTNDLDLQMDSPTQRSKKYLKNVYFCNPINGLIRRSALKQTHLMQQYHGTDVILLLELCLLGQFINYKEVLFHRRETTTNWKKLTKKEKKVFIWGEKIRTCWQFRCPNLNLTLQQFCTIKNSSLTNEQKLRCYPNILFWLFPVLCNLSIFYAKKIIKAGIPNKWIYQLRP